MSPEQHPLHWTDDGELLSAFVLGWIGKKARRDLERHLTACARCAAAVRAEQLLAAGTKRLGRETLKERLGRRLDHPGKKVPWTPILSAAAILVVALGVAYLNRWILLPNGQLPTDAVITEADIPPAGKSVAPTDAPTPVERPDETAAGTTKPRTRSGAVEMKDKQREMEMEEQSAGERTGEAGKADVSPPRLAEATTGEHDEAGEWWSGRHVILGGPGDSLMQDVNPASGLGNVGEKAVRSASQEAGKYLVRQQPVHTLPGRQKAEAPSERGSGLKIRVDRSGETTILTIFADPPFDPAVLSGASVEEAGPDSLVITLGGETFGVSPIRRRNK